MRSLEVVVLGGGPAGTCAALALARDGHRVTIVERDVAPDDDPNHAISRSRKGIPHFLQPHAFLPRGRKEMREGLPDVYQRLVSAGAREIDCLRNLVGGRRPGDDDLRYLAVRRPIIEWALWSAVQAEASIRILSGVIATGIAIAGRRVVAVYTESLVLPADIVVDAMGRRSPMRAWIEQNGILAPQQDRSECGVIYYSRYYQLRPGATLPDGPWYLSPRGDLGYAAFATFPGDSGTFATVLAIAPADKDLRALRDEKAYEAAIASIPMLSSWANSELAEPITPLLPMGSLQNTSNQYEGSISGLFVAADALCHTDPLLALGLSFSFIHGRAIAGALRDHESDAARAYFAEVQLEASERYQLATAIDDARQRLWTGAAVDFAHHDGDYGLFSLAATGAVAMVDEEVLRVFLRRTGMLDRTVVLDGDLSLQKRIEKTYAGIASGPRQPLGPAREEMVATCRSAAASSRW